MSVESSMDRQPSDDMELRQTMVDANEVVQELSSAIAARGVNMSAEEVHMETRKKILKFHSCVKELVKLEQKYGTTAINSIMGVLLSDEDVTRCFRKKPKMDQIREMNIDIEEVNIFAGGFTKVRAEINDGVIFDYYTRNPLNVISGQVSIVNRAAILEEPGQVQDVVNPVNAQLGRESIEVIRQMVQSHPSSKVRWMYEVEDGETSTAGFLQLYSDKSKTTMKVNGLTFYPLHMKLMNVIEEWGNYFVKMGRQLSHICRFIITSVMSMTTLSPIQIYCVWRRSKPYTTPLMRF